MLAILSAVIVCETAAAQPCATPRIVAEVSEFDDEGRFTVTVLPESTNSSFWIQWRGGSEFWFFQQLPFTRTLTRRCLLDPTELRIVPEKCGTGDPYPQGAFSQMIEPGENHVTVDVEWVPGEETGGTLLIPYRFPNTQSSNRWIGVYVDGSLRFERSGSDEPFGVWTIPVTTTCWTPGPHPVEVVAVRCTSDRNPADERLKATARTVITVDTKPEVSLSASEDASGNDTLTIDYSFPNTIGPSQRRIELSLDGAPYASYSSGLTQRTGSFQVSLGSRCWKKAKAKAIACGRTDDERSTDVDEITAQVNEPTVKIALQRARDETQNKRFEAEVVYDFNERVVGGSLKVRQLSWIDADGTEHPGVVPLSEITLGPNEPLSGTKIVYFDPPSGARQVRLEAEIRACGMATDDASIECDCASLDPVYFSDGNMRLTDTDPLPPIAGYTLTRTYDSDEQVVGLFGRGFTTLFERRLMRDVLDDREVVSMVTATNEIVTFERTGSSPYVQKWPTAARANGSLAYDAATATYTHRAAGSTEEAVFRASDGKLVTLRDRASGREATIAYEGGIPRTLTDSWTGLSWTLTVANRRVTSIAISGRPDLTWTYTYDANGNLTTVSAPGTATWRTYEYAANRMTASRDALGNLIESHAFDADGYATDSTGPGDEIESIEYGLPGSSADESITRVTMKTGAVTEYVMRLSGGGLRVVQVKGSCQSCGGSGDRTYVRDTQGRVIREQGADGFITQTAYDGDRFLAEEHPLKPSGCDPSTDAEQCRMTTDELAAATLVSTNATIRTEHTYGDPHWPDRPTSITTPSLFEQRLKRIDLSYHPVSGATIATTITGYAGPEGARSQRGTTTTLYEQRSGGGEDEDDEGRDGLAPAFDPGGTFEDAWLDLPQPALLTRSTNGPRTDADDLTSFVYYPVHSSVPAPLRGRLAATKNAAGHITRFEDYDVFGNVTRAADPNGVTTTMTYDLLGRLLTSTVEGMPGCSPSKDSLCTIDLTTTRTYSPPAGPLRREQRPGGGVIEYGYDARGRVTTVDRGPSASDLRERIETAYDPLTGKKSVERMLASENGAWVEKSRTAYTYNDLAELEAVTHADGAGVAYTYDPAGRVTGIRDENHTTANTLYTYDAAGRLETVRQKLAGAAGGWITTRSTYDLHGNLTSVTDPNGNTTTYVYDDFGALLRQQSPVTGTTRYEYDEAGNLTRSLDANGMATERTYDALGRLVSATSRAAVQSEPPGEGDGRDGETPPPPSTPVRPETVTWTYDDLTPDRFAIGRVATMTDPAGTTTYDYDRRGLLTQEKRVFSGCLVTRESGADCEGFFASRTFITGYRYDRDGNRSTIEYPSNNLNVNYAFDFAGRPVSASGAVTSAQYLPFGPLGQLTFANGTVQTFSYDSRYRVTENALKRGTSTLARYVYEYDAAGNITAINDMLDAGYNRQFGYDDLHRLTTAMTGPALWKDGRYTWDTMGNLLSAKLGEIPPGDDDELLRAGTEDEDDPNPPSDPRQRPPLARSMELTYQGTTPRVGTVRTNNLLVPVRHDAVGNETGFLATRSYSPRNYLQEVIGATDPDEPLQHKLLYSYDGRGIRVVRAETPSNGAGTISHRYFIYTPELKLLGETIDDSPNVWTAASEKDMKHQIIWFGDRPVAQVHLTGGRSYTFADHLGTPILQTNAEATVTWRAEYEPFGHVYAMRQDANGDDIGRRSDQPLRFPGQEYAMTWEGQEENYNIFRWYKGGWGRYTQSDPAIQNEYYTYVGGDPIGAVDPLGLARIIVRGRAFGVTLQELDRRCRDSRGNVTGGACSVNIYTAVLCPCQCSGSSWEMDITAYINFTTYYFEGPWQQLLSTRAPHPSVTNADSAIDHEQTYHLLPTAMMLRPFLQAFENPYATETECNAACMDLRSQIDAEFRSLLSYTQRLEERGGNPSLLGRTP